MKWIFIKLFILMILLNSCSDGIISECPDDTSQEVKSNFSSIQQDVFSKSCALSGCHTGAFPAAGLNLTSGSAYPNIVNKEAFGGVFYVKPGNSAESYLFDRINSTSAATVMPPTGRLPQNVIDSIKLWIDSGALNN